MGVCAVTCETRNVEREECSKGGPVQRRVSHGQGERVFYTRDWEEAFREMGGQLREPQGVRGFKNLNKEKCPVVVNRSL